MVTLMSHKNNPFERWSVRRLHAVKLKRICVGVGIHAPASQAQALKSTIRAALQKQSVSPE